MELTYKPGCKHGLSLLYVSLCMLITIVVGDGITCTTDKSICGCYFSGSGGRTEISMWGINNKNGTPFFSDIPGGNNAWDYFINPCTGFSREASAGACSDVTGCQESTDKKSFFPIGKPGTYSFGPYTKGQPITVTYDPVGVAERQMTFSLVCTPSSEKDIATVDDSGVGKYAVTISSKKVCPKPLTPQAPSTETSSS